jgi:hypothetical protein
MREWSYWTRIVPNLCQKPKIVIQITYNAQIVPFSGQGGATGITPNDYINCNSALPRRITMGMDDKCLDGRTQRTGCTTVQSK